MKGVVRLFEKPDVDWVAWNSGAARFFRDYPVGRSNLTVAVRCRLGSLIGDEAALLDTGAAWSVIGADLAILLDADLGEPLEPLMLSTRLGLLRGHLHRLPITLVADPGCGSDLAVDATVAVIADWPGPVVLGYRGLLERVRFAFEPGLGFDDGTILFGEVQG